MSMESKEHLSIIVDLPMFVLLISLAPVVHGYRAAE
jgi:hypothetical protein